jgi:hypothetical protein
MLTDGYGDPTIRDQALDETTRKVGLYEAAQGRLAARSHGRRNFEPASRSRVPKTVLAGLFFADASVVL